MGSLDYNELWRHIENPEDHGWNLCFGFSSDEFEAGSGDDSVEVIFRDRTMSSGEAYDFCWDHCNGDEDIIAWRYSDSSMRKTKSSSSEGTQSKSCSQCEGVGEDNGQTCNKCFGTGTDNSVE